MIWLLRISVKLGEWNVRLSRPPVSRTIHIIHIYISASDWAVRDDWTVRDQIISIRIRFGTLSTLST